MTILQVQIFVLLLGAFLLGAATACLFRRAFGRRDEDAAIAAAASSDARPAPADTSRFERALSGDPSNAVPTPFHTFKVPVVEVQPIPAPVAPEPAARLAEPAAPQVTEPAPAAAETVVEPPVAYEAPAPVVETPPVEAAAEPVVEAPPYVEPEPVEPPAAIEPEPIAAAPEPEIAPEPVQAEIAQEEPVPSPAEAPEPSHHEPSYTEIAAAAAAVAALATPAAAAPEEPAADAGPADDLTRIRTIDAFWQQRLNQLGVRTFADIARWTESDLARVSQTLGFNGRIEQENWIEQAQILAFGGSVEPAPELTPEDVAATVAVPVAADRLHRIIGIDPATEELLVANGVTRIADIAAWTWQDVEKAEALIGKPGRVGLENWIEQARFLTRAGAPREHAPIGYAPEAIVPESIAEPVPLPAVPPPLVAEPEPAVGPPPQPIVMPTNIAAVFEPQPEPVLEAAPLALEPEPAASEPAEAASGLRSDSSLAGLRSVRSEALRGDAEISGELDDLKRIRGVGVLIERKLYSLGVTSYEQVANWTSADIARISEVLDFKGRIERENWVEQARILASGGQTEFSRRADRGEV